MIPKVGLREEKKAKQKLAIMEAFLKEMSSKELMDINIEPVCKSIGISKVTFFNYFDSKEQVIEYYVYRWQYILYYELDVKALVGKEALDYIYHSASDHPAANAIMNAIMSFFLKQDQYLPMKLTDYEYYLFSREAYESGYRGQSLEAIFMKALRDMPEDEVLVGAIIKSLIVGFYGVPFVNKATGDGDLMKGYQAYLDQLLVGYNKWIF